MNEWEMEMDEQFLAGKIRKQIDGGAILIFPRLIKGWGGRSERIACRENRRGLQFNWLKRTAHNGDIVGSSPTKPIPFFPLQ